MEVNDITGTGEIGKELVQQASNIMKEPILNIVLASTKTLGQRLSEIIDLVFTPIELAKIYKDHKIKAFIYKLDENIKRIPDEKRVLAPINIVGPAIEAAKYHIDDEEIRNMFAELVAGSMNTDKNALTHPSFVDIIRNLSPLDAKLLQLFKVQATYPVCDVQEVHENGTITPRAQTLFCFKDAYNDFTPEHHVRLTSSLDNLIRLGLVIKNRAVIELGYNYELFKNHFMYKAYELAKKSPKNELRIIRARIELTDFGRNFSICCIPEI